MTDLTYIPPVFPNATRGELNNDPLNMNFIDPKRAYNGQIGIEPVWPGHHYTPRFGYYDSAFSGIRAGFRQMIKDNLVYGLASVHDIIADGKFGWAPAADHNDPTVYLNVVTREARKIIPTFDPKAKVQLVGEVGLTLLPALFPGFCIMENGRNLYDPKIVMIAARDALGVPAAYPQTGAAA